MLYLKDVLKNDKIMHRVHDGTMVVQKYCSCGYICREDVNYCPVCGKELGSDTKVIRNNYLMMEYELKRIKSERRQMGIEISFIVVMLSNIIALISL